MASGNRFRRIFWMHLGRVKWRLLLAGLCTLGVSAAGLVKPWPLKIVVDHGIQAVPLPHALSFLQGLLDGDRATFLIAAAASMVAIALAESLFAYLQIFITSSVGYRIVYALRRDLFPPPPRLSFTFHNKAEA